MQPIILAATAAMAVAAVSHSETPAPIGTWDGQLSVPAGLQVPLTLHVTARGATMDSPDQGAAGIPAVVSRKAGQIVFDFPKAEARFTATLSTDGHTLSGAFAQSGISMPARFSLRAPGAAAPVADRPQTPRPPFPYRSEDVSFPGDGGVRLSGTLTRPAGPGPFPAVVLIAGSGPQNRDETISGHRLFLVIADRLTRTGVAVLRYDKRGVGRSTGSYESASTADFAADARVAFDWLRSQPSIAGGKVGLLGHSEGAEIAPTVAAVDPHVSFAVLLSAPGLPGIDILVTQQHAIALALGTPAVQADAESAGQRQVLTAVHTAPDEAAADAAAERLLVAHGMAGPRAAAAARQMASPWFRAFLSDDPAPALRRLRIPVLVVAGSKDLQVLPDANLPVIRAALADDPNARIVELPGLNHLLQPATTGTPQEYGQITTTIAPAALDLIAGWISAQTK